jgi:hypothetical protein
MVSGETLASFGKFYCGSTVAWPRRNVIAAARVMRCVRDLSLGQLGIVKNGNYRVLGAGVRSRTPGPPPFSSMNSIPASSKARRIAKSFAAVKEVSITVNSARRIVVRPTAEARARSSALQRISARPARI